MRDKCDNERLKIKLKFITNIIYSILATIIMLFVTWIFYKMPEDDFPVLTYSIIMIICLTALGINAEIKSLILKIKEKRKSV